MGAVLVLALLGQFGGEIDDAILVSPSTVPRRTSSQTCIACTCTDSTNYALQSIRFDNAAWTASGQSGGSAPTITVSDGSPTYADPAGGFAAQRIQFSACVAANSRSVVLQQATVGVGNVAGSVYIKAFNGSSTLSISVSLYDTSGNTATSCTTTGDWVRCSGTMNASTSGSPFILIGCNNNAAYAGASNTGAADLLVWQGQLEPGTTPTCPITTASTTISRTGTCTSVCTPTTVYATGGTVTTSGGYRIHTFTTSGTLSVANGGAMDVLVVAGGGAGGWQRGGGGGGGGVIVHPGLQVASGDITVTVGAGGTTTTGSGANAIHDGSNSVFGVLTAIGGGGGAGDTAGAGAAVNGHSGGSGGGGCGFTSAGTGGAGTAFQGFAGGNDATDSSTYYQAGGGGGAGAVGSSSLSTGGTGVSNSYSGSAVTYSCGGGGAAFGTGIAGAGGCAAAGNGSKTGAGSAATGYGSGGGGGFFSSNGGAGYQGVVIVRYAYP